MATIPFLPTLNAGASTSLACYERIVGLASRLAPARRQPREVVSSMHVLRDGRTLTVRVDDADTGLPYTCSVEVVRGAADSGPAQVERDQYLVYDDGTIWRDYDEGVFDHGRMVSTLEEVSRPATPAEASVIISLLEHACDAQSF